jgi:hypothetical protein
MTVAALCSDIQFSEKISVPRDTGDHEWKGAL